MRPLVVLAVVGLLATACGSPADPTAPTAGADEPIEVAEPAGTADTAVEGAGRPVTVTDVRLDAHPTFDRIVFEVAGGGTAGWEVGYTDQARRPGSGDPVHVLGRAALELTVTNVALPDDAPEGVRPWDGPDRLGLDGSDGIVELVEGGLFEGRYTFFAGISDKLPFGVARLEAPQRVVVDVLTGRGPEPVALGRRCTNPQGFAVSYPDGWVTNDGDRVTPCSRFAHTPFTVPAETDARVAPIGASIDAVPFHTAAAPDPERERSRAATVVDGRQAVRVERVTSGDGRFPQGTAVTAYLVDLGAGVDEGAGTLVMDAVALPEFDHVRHVRILDRMVRTLTITVGAPAEDDVVTRYEGGGAFRVTAQSRGNEVCLRIPPDGRPTCVVAPAPGEIATVPLPMVGERRVLGGVAGAEVFRVRAEQSGRGAVDVLPAPVPDGGVGAFAFTSAPEEISGLSWYDVDGATLGAR